MAGFILPSNPFAGGGVPEGYIPIAEKYNGILLDDGVNTGTSGITSFACATNAVAHQAGLWNQIDASLSDDSEGILIMLPATNTSAVASSAILEIGVGANGVETVWAQLVVGYRSIVSEIFVPGFIAAGTRVSARIRGIQTGQNRTPFYARFVKARDTTVGAPVSYGCNTATSLGVVLTVAAGNNQKSAWTEITPSTSADHSVMSVFAQGNGNATMTGGLLLLDIGVGAAASEVVIASNLFFQPFSTEAMMPYGNHHLGVDIPSGSRIAARYQCSSADRPDVSLVCA